MIKLHLRHLVLAAVIVLAGCATQDPVEIVKGSASFLIVQAGESEYVKGCTVRGNSDLECRLYYAELRDKQARHYAEEVQQRPGESGSSLKTELQSYLSGDPER